MSKDRFEGLLPDIAALTQEIIDADLDHTKALEVASKADDLVDWAPNAITFCADKRFLGVKPFAKQCEILLALFEEACLRCSDRDYLADIPVADPLETVLLKVALLEFGRCPHCGWTKGDGRAEGLIVDPTELVAPVGQRSGKSAVTSLATSYLLHQNLHLQVPWRSYNLTPGQILDFTFVATTKGQSERTLWAQFKGMFTGSQWFKSYKEVCDLEGKRKGLKVAVKNLETYISFIHKSVVVYAAANDPGALRGSTRIGGAIDEFSWFGSTDGGVRANGPETYAALNNSCLTVRGSVYQQIKEDPSCTWPMPKLFNVSSPVSMDDPLMTLYASSANNPRAVRRHWATWEAHPTNTREYLTEIGEMAKPSADRDYGAQPPLAHNALIHKPEAITALFKSPMATEARFGPVLRPSARAVNELQEFPSASGVSNMVSARLVDIEEPSPVLANVLANISKDVIASLGPNKEVFAELLASPPVNRLHVMGVDLGTSNNGLGIVCGYLAAGKFITDFALEVSPTDKAPINISSVYEDVIVPLVEKLNVVAVFYDQWNSLSQIQDLASKYGSMGPLNDKAARRAWLRQLAKRKERPAFIADKYSLTLADASVLASKITQGDCLFPAMETGFLDLVVNRDLDSSQFPYTSLAVQLATVRKTGSRLLKPLNRDDDLFRAWANAASQAFLNETVIDLLSQEFRGQKMKGGKNDGEFQVLVGQPGKGTRQTTVSQGASFTGGSASFPVIVKKGK